MRKFTCIFFLFFLHLSFSQNFFSVEYKSQADVKIFVVEYKSQADLCVYKVDLFFMYYVSDLRDRALRVAALADGHYHENIFVIVACA